MKYIIINSKHLDKVDFNKVWQTSRDTVRYSADGSKFIVKYAGEQPDFVYTITNDAVGIEEYNYEEISQMLRTPEWTGIGCELNLSDKQILEYIAKIEEREKWKQQN